MVIIWIRSKARVWNAGAKCICLIDRAISEAVVYIGLLPVHHSSLSVFSNGSKTVKSIVFIELGEVTGTRNVNLLTLQVAVVVARIAIGTPAACLIAVMIYDRPTIPGSIGRPCI